MTQADHLFEDTECDISMYYNNSFLHSQIYLYNQFRSEGQVSAQDLVASEIWPKTNSLH